MSKLLDRIARRFGYRVVPERHLHMVYQHDYAGGFDEYKAVQVHHNAVKLDQVWADEGVLGEVVRHLGGTARRGMCHGARNGFEVAYFRKALGADVVGTDIAETAAQFDHMSVWDFHEPNPDWVGAFDFVYSNSLDQAMDPARALAVWADQLIDGGRIFIVHTMAHSAKNAGEMDPFGAHPYAMPYLFFRWGRGLYRLTDIIERSKENKDDLAAWIFVLEKEPASGAVEAHDGKSLI